ncbi:glucose-1-phosphate adenylyltransferase [Paenibacillus darwinianus]|uniref:Glucose-1-phosphate adenylyltransferase n=1 Tax=Paenibacillus darwinianus TaxID=1380763 RepID=A0A9W5RZF0_9BACL|nr:glucose-1-phosphate adenylyltransferase [Paenibacillus darwinianus]EXX86163.1 glucose-1-phosphate adenylyltransferase [Paenibacillus darwinianus]EXX86478.1 glucose-1-phosphate adenylyltransferase [Paenibacillus darwinianus]
MTRNSCMAMLLAGGEGKRLAPLTEKLAKPAVPFGGHYRIIDFPLSNCINSGISTIGVLTQYKAESLHGHVEDGRHWSGGDPSADIFLLPGGMAPGSGYSGTADAIYKNIERIDEYAPEHVLILSGDHIYQMDYREMLDFHVRHGSDATIAVKSVPWKDAHRFGIMNADEEFKVISFTEKPSKPESNLASMGIYLFRWSFLKEKLMTDAQNETSNHDFGNDVIPELLHSGAAVFAYPFKGYWRDVGTVESLWEAHMDMLDGEMKFEGDNWPMYTNEVAPYITAYRHPLANISEAVIHPLTAVEGDVERSILFGGVRMGRGSKVKESIIMPNVKIGRDVQIFRTIIGEGCVIEDGAVIGRPDGEITVLGADELVFARNSSLLSRTNELIKGMVRQDAAAAREGFSTL